jgi:hypothetical protein
MLLLIHAYSPAIHRRLMIIRDKYAGINIIEEREREREE